MNTSTATTEPHGNRFKALYSVSWERDRQIVTDERGRVLLFADRRDALICAQQALLAALEPPIRAQRYDPRITVDRKPWQVIRPRSRAGRKALFASLFEERASA